MIRTFPPLAALASSPEILALQRRFVVEEALSVIRHDTRNRLAAIRNAAFYLKKKLPVVAEAAWQNDPRIAQFLGLIETEAVEAGALLAASFPSEPKASFSLDGIVDGSALRAVGDPQELRVALACLVENSVDAGAGSVAITAREAGERIAIDVTDDGAGFAPGAEDRALEPGFTTRAGRLGLGLNVASRIARRAGGGIELAVVSPGGGGMRATILLGRAAS